MSHSLRLGDLEYSVGRRAFPAKPHDHAAGGRGMRRTASQPSRDLPYCRSKRLPGSHISFACLLEHHIGVTKVTTNCIAECKSLFYQVCMVQMVKIDRPVGTLRCVAVRVVALRRVSPRPSILVEPQQRRVRRTTWVEQHGLFAVAIIGGAASSTTFVPKWKMIVLSTSRIVLDIGTATVAIGASKPIVLPGEREPPVTLVTAFLSNGILGTIMVDGVV